MRRAPATTASSGTLDAPGRVLVLGVPEAALQAGPGADGALRVPPRPPSPGAVVADRIRGALLRWLEAEM
jgi:hypothetical protein